MSRSPRLLFSYIHLGLGMVKGALIPSPTDQNRCAQSRKPMDMIVQGWSTSFVQASQQ